MARRVNQRGAAAGGSCQPGIRFAAQGGALVKRLRLLVAALLVSPLLGADEPRGAGDAVAAAAGLDGEWKLVGRRVERAAVLLADPSIFFFRRGAWAFRVGPGQVRGVYTADPYRAPACLDKTFAGGSPLGEVLRCIYRVEGDTLWVAFRRGGSGRAASTRATRIWSSRRTGACGSSPVPRVLPLIVGLACALPGCAAAGPHRGGLRRRRRALLRDRVSLPGGG
jgi:uncharacterized protein (TIGR03067 family)